MTWRNDWRPLHETHEIARKVIRDGGAGGIKLHRSCDVLRQRIKKEKK